jgi:hypothetical protein
VVGLSGRATSEARSEPVPRQRRVRRGEQAPAPEESSRVIGLLDTVEQGETLGLADGSTLWLLERPNTLWRLMGPARYALGPRGIKASAGAPGGLAPLRMALEGLTEDASESGTAWRQRPLPDDRSVQAGAESTEPMPRETAIVDPRPTLAWQTGNAGERYTVALWRLDDDGQLVPLERWASLQTARLRPWQALPRGAFVHWQLAGQDGVGPTGAPDSAWLYVMTAAQVEALRSDLEALDLARAQRPEAAEALEVVEAWTRERHGLLEDAATAYRALGARRDLDSPTFTAHLQALARRVLSEPRERRGSPAAEATPAPQAP